MIAEFKGYWLTIASSGEWSDFVFYDCEDDAKRYEGRANIHAMFDLQFHRPSDCWFLNSRCSFETKAAFISAVLPNAFLGMYPYDTSSAQTITLDNPTKAYLKMLLS